mmetsp:Transcript_148632/g.475949  ORF Transcript_148632/g.475949 Transcript_148632/m.475949 type:complete len:213 (+) Transcript_148632:119-757(+)
MLATASAKQCRRTPTNRARASNPSHARARAGVLACSAGAQREGRPSEVNIQSILLVRFAPDVGDRLLRPPLERGQRKRREVAHVGELGQVPRTRELRVTDDPSRVPFDVFLFAEGQHPLVHPSTLNERPQLDGLLAEVLTLLLTMGAPPSGVACSPDGREMHGESLLRRRGLRPERRVLRLVLLDEAHEGILGSRHGHRAPSEGTGGDRSCQ